MKRNLLGIVIAVVLVGIGAGLLRLGGLRLGSNRAISIKEIQTSGRDSAEAAQDVVVFTDGTTLQEIGYDLVHVGTITLSKAKPVFLFKSYSCRACEPSVELWVYNAQARTAERFVYPGQHDLTSTEATRTDDLMDRKSAGVFGSCDETGQPLVVLAQKHREIESDGNSLRAGDWTFTTTTLRFQADGTVNADNRSEDAFEAVQSMSRRTDCMEIEPEDSHDYL